LNPPIGIWNLHLAKLPIIWPNNSTPNSGCKWLNSNKKFLQPTWAWILKQNYSFEVLIKWGENNENSLEFRFQKPLNRFFESNRRAQLVLGTTTTHLVTVEVHVIIWWLKAGPFMESISILDIWVISIHLQH
jgi:hypothetical protein